MPTLRQRPADDQLVDRARAGDHAAFATLLRRHDEAMRRLAFRLLADADAMDDALQDAYLRAYRALPSYGNRAQFGSWLYRITYNACIDELRRARRRPVTMADPPEVAAARAGPER
ncbi:MAG TPA: sigma-70 family RNA polymerase sigma factor, partial [Acidimicrobiales bacterium]|nr:sigma-70 family RNA polymerase sigma factor [Acidimicrobiales bacterium]